MDMPSYVNPKALLSAEEMDRVIMGHPSTVARGRLYAHLAVTNAVLNELAIAENRMREQVASWLDKQGGVYIPVAKAVREGKTPDLAQPIIPTTPVSEAKLRAQLEEALQQRDTLRVEIAEMKVVALTSLPAHTKPPIKHPKPWAVRRKDGTLDYYDNRATARREALGDIVVDCR